MLVDRFQTIQIVEGMFEKQDTEFLDVYLDQADIELLANPERRYTGDRFMGCTADGLNGWAFEDKIHIKLETPVKPEDALKIAELSLDVGGDLYFTIWDAEPLRKASQHEEFLVESAFVVDDPSNKLRQVGISAIRLHQLNDLAAMLIAKG